MPYKADWIIDPCSSIAIFRSGLPPIRCENFMIFMTSLPGFSLPPSSNAAQKIKFLHIPQLH